jgi:hypothetical protein
VRSITRYGLLLSLVLIPMLPSAVSASAAAAPSGATAPSSSTSAFARVYLAIRGCTSCSHCRTAIRQMVATNAKGGEARLSRDQVEIRYTTPRPIPLRSVIQTLAENRLHDLSLVDVLFEARGSLAKGPNGSAVFTLSPTGQSFPISFHASARRPPDGTPVHLTALVEGWRGKGDLALVARSLEPVN